MALTNYDKSQKLGEGTYGAVFRAVNNKTQETVALKLVRMDQEDDGIPSTSLREISILQSTNHANIINLQEILCEEGRVTMVFEFMERDLRHYIDRLQNKDIPTELLRSYSFQLLCGIYYLHQNGILHRDIRPENLLIDRKGFLKICDFGNARICHRPFASFDGNDNFVWYFAPELLFPNHPFDFPSDIWSCGCAIVEMTLKKSLFNGDSQIDQMNQIIRVFGTPTQETWPEFKDFLSPDFPLPQRDPVDLHQIFHENIGDDFIDLISGLLTMNPKKRLTAEQAVHHKYFDTIPPQLREVCLKMND